MNSEQTTQQNVTSPKKSIFEGRINRLAFFLGHLILIGGFVGAILVVMMVYALLNYVFGDTNTVLRSVLNIGVYLVGVTALIAYIVAMFSLYIRRLHDINVTGWVSLLLLINPAALILYVVLQAVEPTAGDNKYGPEERPSTLLGILGRR